MKTRFLLIGAAIICFVTGQSAPGALSTESPRDQIVVTSALFGNGIKIADVTKRVAELLRSEQKGFSARGDWLRADPIPYKIKALVITYEYKGKQCTYLVPGGEKVSYELLIANAER